ATHVLGVQADGMAAALMRENGIGLGHRGIEIAGAIDREHERELLPGEREVATDTGLLHHEELFSFSRRRQAAAASEDVGIARDQRARELAVWPQRGLDLRLLRRRRHI